MLVVVVLVKLQSSNRPMSASGAPLSFLKSRWMGWVKAGAKSLQFSTFEHGNQDSQKEEYPESEDTYKKRIPQIRFHDNDNPM